MIMWIVVILLLPITYYVITRKTEFETPPEFKQLEKEGQKWLNNK